jgi:hypothetical protein
MATMKQIPKKQATIPEQLSNSGVYKSITQTYPKACTITQKKHSLLRTPEISRIKKIFGQQQPKNHCKNFYAKSTKFSVKLKSAF